MLLSDVQKFAVAKVLKEDEVNELGTSIRLFFDEFDRIIDPKTGKPIQMTVKCHILRHHVHAFVKNHDSWGIYGEQGRVSYIKN